MKYFDKYLKANTNFDVKILISSDIAVFEWILKYATVCYHNKRSTF